MPKKTDLTTVPPEEDPVVVVLRQAHEEREKN